MWPRCFKPASAAVEAENAEATLFHSSKQRLRSRLVSCLSGAAKCPVRRKQPAAVGDQPVLLGNPLYSEAGKSDAAEDAASQLAALPFADTIWSQTAEADSQVQLHFS